MSKPKRPYAPKYQLSQRSKFKNSKAFLRRHLRSLDLILSSLLGLVFFPLATLYVITVFSTVSTPKEVANSTGDKATTLVSTAPTALPVFSPDKQAKQLTSPPANDASSENTVPVANVSDPAKPTDDSNTLEPGSRTPNFIKEEVAARHPFDLAGQVTQAQAAQQPVVGGVSPTDFGFTGQRQENFGLMDYGGRYYSPALGRFISADPILPNYGNPQALNRYSYVYNNPVKYTDPSGHCTEWEGRPDGLCTRNDAHGNLAQIVRGGSIFPNYVEKSYANTLLTGNPNYMNQVRPDIPAIFLSHSFQNVEEQLGYREPGLELPIDPYSAVGMSMAFGSLVEDGISAGSFFAKGETTQHILQGLANQANKTVLGRGPVAGTLKHTEFANLVKGLGRDDLRTEQSYFNGRIVDRGFPGSIRVDVVEGPLDAPIAVYDFKTGSATLTPARIQQIQSHLPGGENVPVIPVYPSQ